MSYLENLSDGEYEASIAAAAYAITTMEEEGDSLKRKKSAVGLARAKSKLGEKSRRANFNLSFKWLSGKEPEEGENEIVSGDFIWHNAVEAERATTGNYSSRYNNAGEETYSSPTFKEMSTFTKKYPNEKRTKRLQSGKDVMEGIKAPSISKPSGILFGNRSWDKESTEPGRIETKADAWEKAKMVKAKNRYERMITVISEWQTEKKTKARLRMEKKEGGPADKHEKALRRYNNEISRIDKIAGDARALAKERKQNDEAKIREKVAKIRLKGNMPGTCCNCL